MQAPVPGRTHVIKFFEGMCKMLPAVISGRKGNIRNVKSAVAQKKGGLLHTLAVDISVDGTAVFFCKKCLEVGFIDPCICGNGRNIDVFQIMFINIPERFFQINTSLGVPAGAGAESKFCEHTAKQKKEEKFFLLYLTGTALQKGEKVFQAVSEIPGIRAGAESPGGGNKITEPGKSGIFFQKKVQRNRAFFGGEGKFQIQDRAWKTVRDLKPVRDTRAYKDKLPGFQRKFHVLFLIHAENPAGTGSNVHDLIAGMCVMFHMIIRQGKGIKGGNMKISGRILKNVWHEKPPEHVVRSRISI